MKTGWKVAAALILVVLALASFMHWIDGERADARADGVKTGKHEVQERWDGEKLEAAAAAASATDDQRRIEQRRQSLAMEAVNAATNREVTLRADAGNARSELDGLRLELAASRSALSGGGAGGASCQAVRARAAALTDVFESCASRYQGVAEKADRHASDALMFDQAWPTDAPLQLKGASYENFAQR